MDRDAALAELTALRHDLSDAAQTILAAAEAALEQLQRMTVSSKANADEVSSRLFSILEACAFEDLAGQRVSKLDAFIRDPSSGPGDPLLNGPALTGTGLDQGAADALLGGETAPQAR